MMNFLLAIVIFFIVGLIQGVPSDKALVDGIVSGSPAEEAGFQKGDKIVRIEGNAIAGWDEFDKIVKDSPGKELDMTVKRNGSTETLTVTPDKLEGQGITIGQVGVQRAFEQSYAGTIQFGFEKTYDTTKMILTNLGMLVTGQYSIEMLSGPVGIYDATDQVVQAGFISFLMWTAILSVNLGIINLVPIPALDGGRLLFVGIEAVRGKPVDPQKEGIVHLLALRY